MRALLIASLLSLPAAAGPMRLKELVELQGQRENALIGYGLVVGLANTGDSEQVLFTMQSVAGLLGRMGVRVDPRDVRSRNVAAVMVTAKLPTFSRVGNTFDVTVSAMGNARSIAGGTLLLTPLTGADGNVYAVSQGPVQVGGFDVTAAFAAVRKNTPTSGTVPQGATVEKAVTPAFAQSPMVLRLRRPDFTNATRIASSIAQAVGADRAKALDSSAVEVSLTDDDKKDPVALVAKLEALEIDADVRAKVVVSERTGTVVVGQNVRLSPAAVAHGGLRVSISTQFSVSQPNPFATGGRTILMPMQAVDAQEAKNSTVKLAAASNVDDLVKALNALGATPRDLVAVLQALKSVGSLDAELEVQ